MKFAIITVILVFPFSALTADLPEERMDALALQLFLDSQDFGPGRFDGRWGEFTRKAVDRWNEGNPNRNIALAVNGPEEGTGMKLWGERSVLANYTISAADRELVGEVPEAPEKKAEQERLPYDTLLEVIAEKFHADPALLKELNPSTPFETLGPGVSIRVPNLENPFDLNGLPTESSKGAGNADLSVKIYLNRNVLEVHGLKMLRASFPISVGEQGNSTPVGDWKVNVVQWMPEFRYDEKMLEQGERSDDAFMLPPGPNSPVGVVWIGLDSDGIGIHGTANAEAIGRNTSSGCIRLANWDAAKLGKMIQVGTSVEVLQ
ncbi:MAG: L,D-transpeptidase [Verrucomicrobiales bacterium]|nr:L,D-transpeptidase [Verrucomicrobiales bacterium]